MTKPTVFISYSHKDEIWKDRLNRNWMRLKWQNKLLSGMIETVIP